MASVLPGRFQAAQLVSPQARLQLRRRWQECAGAMLALAGLALVVALASYDPHDPSLDTATAAPVTNLAGSAGAVIADLMLQYFGAAGALPGLALIIWGWRVASHRQLNPGWRLASLVLALPALATAIAILPHATAIWPTRAGLGGVVGLLTAHRLRALGTFMLGPLGGMLATFAALGLGLGLAIAALGLTPGEWRAAARGTAAAARGTALVGRHGAGLAGRVPRLVAWLFRPLLRTGPHPDEPIQPETRARDAGRRGDASATRAAAYPVALGRPVVPGGIPPMRDSEEDDDGFAGESDPGQSYPGQSYPGQALVPRLSAAAAPATPAARAVAPPRGRAARKGPPEQESLPLEEGWQFPPLSLLSPPPRNAAAGPSRESLEANARLLETVLADYGVQGVIRDMRPGPVVTLYELEPAPGIRSARVIGLADDIARSLSVTAVRIATVPGRNVIGIEVPNPRRETVYLSELLGGERWAENPARLALALGKDIGGDPVTADLARMPHLLIAGTTGSGKSVGINAMILSLLYRLTPDQCRMIMIDPKMLELSVYDGIPHLLAPVVTDPKKAVAALKWTVQEMLRRYRAMNQLGVRNIGGYNDRVADARAKGEVVTRKVQTGFDTETGRPVHEEQPLALESLPFIVVVIDEMADLMMVAGKEIEAAVQRLAQMARAAGIHVIMATQRPSVDVITGTIKANFPTRISFQVISKFDSRTILGEQGAEQLLGMGDLLYMVGGGRITRVHGPFVDDREVEAIVAFLRAQGAPVYDDGVTELQEDDGSNPALTGIAAASDGEKDLFDQAVALVAREGKASTSFVQRGLRIGYNRAADLIERMEKEGIVSGANHVGKREVLVRRPQDD
jgi:S-DNA-T family DNA segregation ATPase FtsK/SpoIIIE